MARYRRANLPVWNGDESGMTDREKLLALLNEWGVPYLEEHSGCVLVGNYAPGMPVNPEKIDGYSGFYTSFDFDTEGQFLKMGAWE